MDIADRSVRVGASHASSPGEVPDRLASDIDGALIVPEPSVPSVPERPKVLQWPPPRRRRRLPKGWQLGAAIAGWPLWWALGVTNMVFPLLMAPLAWQLVRRGRIRVPPGFWIWGLFLLLVAISAVAIDVEAADTVTSTGVGRYLAYLLRFANYLSVTVAMLYIGNLAEESCPGAG